MALRRRCLFFVSFFIFAIAEALPKGGRVVSGEALFHAEGDKSLKIVTSERALLHWDEFSIASKELARFIQPGKDSLVVNRVIGGNPSAILGRLEANGRLFLINPNGILVGKEGVVQVGSFIASTLERLEGDPFKGEDLLFSGEGKGKIVNLGRITAGDGDLFLLAPRVINEGRIEAPKGVAAVGVGREMLLVPEGKERLFIRLGAASSSEEAGLDQTGEIEALQVELKSKGNPYALAIRHKGRIDALASEERGGRIFLMAEGGKVQISGEITASNPNGVGGSLFLLGEEIGLFETASLDVSGKLGGGELFLGGDFQGSNPRLPNARQTVVKEGAKIAADAQERGDGGRVFAWSSEATGFYGTLSVRGGSEGGNGGLAALLGEGYVDFRGRADRLAPQGRAGTLILDPTNLTICERGDADVPRLSPFHPLAADGSSVLNVGTLKAALQEGDVIVQSAGGKGREPGDVILSAPLAYHSDYSLTLRSFVPEVTAGDVQINSPIENSGEGGLILDSSRDININASVATQGQEGITLTGGRDIRLCQPVKTQGSLSLSASEEVDLFSEIEAAKGISISSKGKIELLAPLKASGSGIVLTSEEGISLLASLKSEGMGGIRLSGQGDLKVGSKESRTPCRLETEAGAIHLTTTQGEIVLSGGREEGACAKIVSATGAITLNATAPGREIRLEGGSAPGAKASIQSGKGTVSLWSGGSVRLFSGSSELADVAAELKTERGALRLRALEEVSLQGGGRGPFANPAVIESQEGNIEVTASDASLMAGAGRSSGALIESGTKGIALTVQNLFLKGGSEGEESMARIHSASGRINIHTAGALHLQGGENSLCYAEISSQEGNVVFNQIGKELTLQGGGAQGAYAQIGVGKTEGAADIKSDLVFYAIGGDVTLQGGLCPSAYAQIGHSPFGSKGAYTVQGDLIFPEGGIEGGVKLLGGEGAAARIGSAGELGAPQSFWEGDLHLAVQGEKGILAQRKGSGLFSCGDLDAAASYGMTLEEASLIAAKDVRLKASTFRAIGAHIESERGNLTIEAKEALFGEREMKTPLYCSASQGELFVRTEKSCQLLAGEKSGVELLSLKSATVRSLGSLKLQGGEKEGADVTITSAFGDVVLNASEDITLEGGSKGKALVSNLGGGRGDLTAVADRDLVLGKNASFENYGQGELNAFADRDVKLFQNSRFLSSGMGVLAAAAGRDMVLRDDAKMTQGGSGNLFIVSGRHTFLNDRFAAKTASGTLHVVVDHYLPGHPLIGDGSLIKTEGASLSSMSGRVMIYTARREQNHIDGPINGELYLPGPAYADSAYERWFTFFDQDVKTALDFFWVYNERRGALPVLLASNSSSSAPPFVIYYKDGLRTSIPRSVSIAAHSEEWKGALAASNRIARAESEALQDFRTLSEFLFVPKRFLVSYDAALFYGSGESLDSLPSFNQMLDEYEILLRKVRTYNTKRLSRYLKKESGNRFRYR